MKEINTNAKELQNLNANYDELKAMNQQLRERISELELINAINLSLSNTLDRDETLESIRQFFQTTFILDQFCLMLRTASKGELEVVSSFGVSCESGYKLENKDEKNIFYSVLQKGEPVYISNCQIDTRFDCAEFHKDCGGSLVSLPLRLPPDEVIGVLTLYRNTINAFSTREISRISHITNHVALVIDKTLIFHQTKQLSITDPLTGIYNRRYFDERFSREITRAIRYNREISLLLIDVDHFKQYNDTLGHFMGDVALKQLANLLEQKLRQADIVARYGGEEFVVLLPEIQRSNAHVVAEKLRAAVEHEKFEGEEKLPNKNVTISIGIATFPDDTTSMDELKQLADEALYAAKKTGRNCVRQAG